MSEIEAIFTHSDIFNSLCLQAIFDIHLTDFFHFIMIIRAAFPFVALRRAVCSVIAALFFIAFQPGAYAQTPPVAKPAPSADARATATAQIMAGVTPLAGDAVIDRLAATEGWLKHKEAMEAQWKPVRARLDAIEKWREQEIKLKDVAGRTLLYPFSGPDFLNAWSLYPNHGKYLFFSLESPGTLPDLEKMGPKEFEALLRDVRNAFTEIFQRNYFITSYMGKQLTTPYLKGSVPIIATMMALNGLRIAKIEAVDPFPELTKAYHEPKSKRPGRLLRGVKITFLTTANKAHELSYFSLDATDNALRFYPEFLDWAGRNKPASALIKSASYLLHDNQFSRTRDMILASADILVQDDTGIPYRYLKQANWNTKLFGKYHRPIKPMEWGYQSDLDRAFKEVKDGQPLPFPFGYHWKGQESGLILATRP
jgi:hypothetical protein